MADVGRRVSLASLALSAVDQVVINQDSTSEDEQIELSEKDVKAQHRRSYIHLTIASFSVFLANLGYYTMAGVFTSLNAQLGFVAFGVLWLTMMFSQLFLAAPMVNAIGSRITVTIANVCSTLFILLNFYQSWPTLVLAGFFEGLGSALRWTGVYSSVHTAAKELAKAKKQSSEHYVSVFNGILYLFYFFSVLLGSILSAAFLLPSQPFFSNKLHNVSLADANSTNHTHATCMDHSDEFVVPTWAYYSLVAVASVLTSISIALACGLGKVCGSCSFKGVSDSCHQYRTTVQKTNCHEGLKKFVTKYYKPVLRSFFRFRYASVMVISFLSGISEVYYFGTFSRHFISECLGVGVVGLTIIVSGVGSSVSSVLLGKISYYTSRTVVAIATALLHAGMILFMLFWEREPSYVMVFLISLGWGIVDGVWITLPAIYIGIVAKHQEASAAFAVNFALFSFGGAASFFISGYIEVNIILWILLSVLIVAVIIYIIGEKVLTPSKQCRQRCSSESCQTSEAAPATSTFTMVFKFGDDPLTKMMSNDISVVGDRSLWDKKMSISEVYVNPDVAHLYVEKA